MNDAIILDSIRHGREMYAIGLEHAINMLEIGGMEVLPGLKSKLKAEREEIENLRHSRHNADHYRNCTDCYNDHLDFEQEMRMDEQADAADHQSELEGEL